MKRYFLCLLGLLQFLSIVSKAQNQCGSTFNPLVIQNLDPDRYNRYVQLEQTIANYIASTNGNSNERLISQTSTIIIPVVVHVLHNGEPIGIGNNISDAQVQSQIDVLNEDFRRLNADRINTPAAFAGVTADPNFEFRLACTDQNGNATNGIHRVLTNVNAFTFQINNNGSVNEQATGIKFTAQGGTDAWPTDQYLNIWVCNIAPAVNGQLLGYAQFPFDFAVSPNTDGVVILNTAFGRVGNLRFLYDQGRTATHEIGHWLDLFHIWGDATCGDDHCNDTPQQFAPNQSNCPVFPHQSNCPNNGANGDMFMNYMDYTVDGCKNIYTQDQTNRTRAVFANGGPRAAFINNYFHINPVSNSICTTGQIAVTNLTCLPVTWSVVSGPATIQSGQGTNTVTLQKSGDGVAIIRATAGGHIDENQIYFGSPSIQSGFYTYTNYPYGSPMGLVEAIGNEDNEVCYTVRPTDMNTTMDIRGATSVVWQKNTSTPTTLLWDQTGNDLLISFRGVNQTGNFSLTVSNTCAIVSKDYIFKSVTCSQMFRVSPNPASNNLTISTIEDNTMAASKEYTNDKSFSEIRVFDMQSNLKKYQRFNKAKQATINISDLRLGIYIVEVSNGTYKERHQLSVQK